MRCRRFIASASEAETERLLTMALVAETDRLQVMLESGGAGAVSSCDRPAVVAAGVSRHPHGASAGPPAWQRSACVNVSSGFADIDESLGACLQRASLCFKCWLRAW